MLTGDHPENDVTAAQYIGMTGIWKKDAQRNEVDADFIIDDLIEIPSKINEINNKKDLSRL